MRPDTDEEDDTDDADDDEVDDINDDCWLPTALLLLVGTPFDANGVALGRNADRNGAPKLTGGLLFVVVALILPALP